MKQFSRSRRRRPSSVVAVASVATVCGLVLAGCQADPGDAPTVDDAEEAGEAQPGNPGEGDGDDGASAVPEELRTITVGVDRIPADLNPHLVGSRSMLTSTVADLTLPSAFTVDSDGHRTVMNSDLLDSVDVRAGDEDAPTQVRYTLAREAQWSDGSPISGSDFHYLWQQVMTMPGTTDNAGYADISDLTVSAGGNTVTVTFSRPQADWRELFAHLLPSHIYGAEGRNFVTALGTLPAASGGVYTVRQFDPGRGNLVLERNTRYWGESPARTDRVVFSESGDLNTSTQMLRAGQFQMLTTRSGAVTAESVDSLPGVGSATVDLDTRLDLVPNAGAGRMADPDARRALLSGVDADQVARLVTGDPDAVAPEGGVGAYRGHGGYDAAGGAAEAVGATSADPLRIAADTLDDEAVEAARRVVDQLGAVGVPATVVTPSSADLYSAFLPRGDVDAVVVWQDRDRSRTDLHSEFACDDADRPMRAPSQQLPTESELSTEPEDDSTDGSDGSDGAATQSAGSASGSAGTGTPDDAPTTTADGDDAPTARGSNVSGFCDPEVDTLLQEGSDDEVRARLSEQALSLPLFGDRVVVGRSVELVGPAGRVDSWPMGERSGPFVTVAGWSRAGGPGAEAETDAHDTDTTGEADDD
ncbi:ABC transporter family substrate-binding protein [Corynebacterium sp.]|uniref:ABC transporter family substrate-binding protein n=1 Tax=Corynebacterium sp. TaxID=1720 RepID=UPI003B3A6694